MKMRDVGAPLVGAQGGHKGRPYVGYFESSRACPPTTLLGARDI